MENEVETGIHSPDWLSRGHFNQQWNRSPTDAHLLPLHHPPPAPAFTPSSRRVRGYCHGAMKHVIPYLLGIVVLKYQSKPDTLFHQYTVYLWCSLVSTCIYWLMIQPIKHMLEADASYRFQILTCAEPAFALLSVSSLLSVLLPYHIAWVPLVLWTLVSVILAWPLYCCAYTWTCIGSHSIITWFMGFFEFDGGNSEVVVAEGNPEEVPKSLV